LSIYILEIKKLITTSGINQKTTVDKNNKARRLMARLCYIDGLVSTGNQIPYTILKRIFANIKLFPKNFINIFNTAVDNSGLFKVFLQP
jgi:hypothetical protein